MKKNKTKLEQLAIIDGKADLPADNSPVPTSLDQILGYNGHSRYQTMDSDEYEEKIKGMNLSDLQTEAVNQQLLPNQSRDILISRLVREFKIHVSAHTAASKTAVPPVKVDKEAQRILDQGR